MRRQFDVFDMIKEKGETVDYVTMTIGGNDVHFADVVTTCAMNNYAKRDRKPLDDAINEVWDEMDSTRARIKDAYIQTADNAGEQAEIYIAGYPKLFSPKGSGVLIDEEEAAKVNQNAHDFNEVLKGIVAECNDEGYDNIYFVDVEAEFDKDGGHGAYSKDAWLNSIKIVKRLNDHVHAGFGSSYSVHPNKDGSDAYARCVSNAIAENAKKKEDLNRGSFLNWEVMPEIKADDILVGDRYNTYDGSSYLSSPFVYIKRDGKYGLIGYDGNIRIEPEYDSFNGSGSYGLDEFIGVYDSKSGDSVFSQYYDGVWRLNEVQGAFGAPGIGTSSTTFFIDKNSYEFYRYTSPYDTAPEAIYGGVDDSYVVQKIEYDSNGSGFGESRARDESFYLYSDAGEEGRILTDGYEYVYSNGSGACSWSGSFGNRVIYSGYPTVAFANNRKQWDIYDSLGELIAHDLEPFDCNCSGGIWWAPTTSFFDDFYLYKSSFNTDGDALPFCATEGYIAAKIDGECGYLDLDGNEFVEFGILEDVRPVHDGKAWAKFNGSWGVLSFE